MDTIYIQIIKVLPWWVWVLFATGIVGYFINLKKDHRSYVGDETTASKKGVFDPSNYEARQTMMNSSERVFFETLRRAIGDKFDIYPQVNLDKIFKTKYLEDKFAFNGARWAIDRRSVDYLLVNKETQSPKIAIELDGSSHERQDRIERDEKVASIFENNGVPLVRFNAGDNFNESELRAKFERYF